MGNLLDPRTGLIHADVNKDHGSFDSKGNPFRRALCDLYTVASDTWIDVKAAKVTCPGCDMRIDMARAAAMGEFDPRGLLSSEALIVAMVLYGRVQEEAGLALDDYADIGDVVTGIANALYPDDDERRRYFLERALDGETA